MDTGYCVQFQKIRLNNLPAMALIDTGSSETFAYKELRRTSISKVNSFLLLLDRQYKLNQNNAETGHTSQNRKTNLRS